MGRGRVNAAPRLPGVDGVALARDPARVAEDVRNGIVSVESARTLYGIALAEDGRIDETETARLRTHWGAAGR